MLLLHSAPSASSPSNVNVPELLIYDIASITAGSLVTLLLTAYFLYYFTSKGPLRSWLAYIALGITYFITLSSLYLIAIDLATGLHAIAANEDISHINLYFVIMWRVVYWSIQLLAWIAIPICQMYVLSGEFTFLRRLRTAILGNAIFYAVAGVLVVVLIIAMVVYVVISNAQKQTGEETIQLTFDMFVGIGMSLSNAFGLLLLTLFLGYGLVELPRYLWRMGNNAWQLQYLEFQAAKLLEEVEDADDELLLELMRLESLNKRVQPGHKLRQLVDHIMQRSSADLSRHARNLPRVREDLVEPTRSNLVSLNKSIISCQRRYRQAAYRWEHLQNKAFYLEDVIKARNSGDKRIDCPFKPHPIRRKLGKLGDALDRLEWFYMIHLRNIWNKTLAVVFVIFGIILLWCQLTPIVHYFTGVNISVFFYTFKLFLLFKNKFMMQALSLFLMIMTAAVAYFGLFRIKLFSFYRLVPHHSDVYSLLFNAMMMCRVIPTMLFNYVSIVGLSDLQGDGPSNVAFVQVMGTMRLDQLEFFGQLGRYFADFFPLIIPLISIMTLLDIIPRLASLCGVDQRFVFKRDETKLNNEAILEGKELLRKQRQRRMRGGKAMDMDDLEKEDAEGRRKTRKGLKDEPDSSDVMIETIELDEDFDLNLNDLENQLEGGKNSRSYAPGSSAFGSRDPVDRYDVLVDEGTSEWKPASNLRHESDIHGSRDHDSHYNDGHYRDNYDDDYDDDDDEDYRVSQRTRDMLAQLRSGDLL